MSGRTMKRVVMTLIIISAVIYSLQIIIFHDERTTIFYIFQDMAFMPFTIAIATIVVGELINRKEKADRIENTKMLTSVFFTEMGTQMLKLIAPYTGCEHSVAEMIYRGAENSDEEAMLRAEISKTPIKIALNEKLYDSIRALLRENQTGMMILSSNPMLLEHEDFTEMLWGLFHLIDEFKLHGDYASLQARGREHMAEDIAKVYRLIVLNGITNASYLKDEYPTFYAASKNKFINPDSRKGDGAL